jgi:hypothetical protein
MAAFDSSGVKPNPGNLVPLKVTAAVLLLSTAVIAAGIGLVATVGRRGDASTWARWGNVGQTFEAVNSVVSALALAGLLISWYFESRNMQVARLTLQRSLEAEVRNHHLGLVRLAMNDPQLAAVWPRDADGDAVTQKQHFYANELIQYMWLAHVSGLSSRSQLVSDLRFLFTSPKIRAYWKDTAATRRAVYTEGSAELGLAALADAILAEYEAVLSCSAGDERRGAPRSGP